VATTVQNVTSKLAKNKTNTKALVLCCVNRTFY